MQKTNVVLFNGETLTKEQEDRLKGMKYELYFIQNNPTIHDINKHVVILRGSEVIFASVHPFLLKQLSSLQGVEKERGKSIDEYETSVRVFFDGALL